MIEETHAPDEIKQGNIINVAMVGFIAHSLMSATSWYETFVQACWYVSRLSACVSSPVLLSSSLK